MNDQAKKRVGRPPKYSWADKRDLCYKLYVEEQKSPAEIIKYFTEHFDVDPSEIPCRKGFHRQFQIWGFKTHIKKLTPEEEDVVRKRMEDLWNQNVYQKDIKAILADEGYQLKTYEFNKLWRRAGLRLRNDSGYRPPDAESKKRKRASEDVEAGGDGQFGVEDAVVAGAAPTSSAVETLTAGLTSEQATARAQRLWEIQVDSDQKLAARKRRRRIRGYGHLPPDAPGTAPRYASETSLDECKAYLSLSNEMYNTVRKDFATICEELGIIKKTLCGEGVWEGSKQRLVRENLHLSAVLHPLQPDLDKKAIALDCLCADVTKRMRVKDRAITIAEANNTLGINPTQSKALRRSFYEILASENFESKLVSGGDHWTHIRQRWHDTSDILQQVVNEKDDRKMKCLDLLCSDATKRFREDKNKRGERPVVQHNAKYGPGPGPAWAATAPRSKHGAPEKLIGSRGSESGEAHVRAVLETAANYPPQPSANLMAPLPQAAAANIDFDIDPALTAPGPFTSAPLPESGVRQVSAYFRLNPASRIVGHHPAMWLGTLTNASVDSLHQAASSKAGATRVASVHGIIKNDNGSEDSWLIENDDELKAYLNEAGEKATFTVGLEGGYA